MDSQEEIIRVIRTEGRSARNVVSWSVPADGPAAAADNGDDDEGFTTVGAGRGRNSKGADGAGRKRRGNKARRAKPGVGDANRPRSSPAAPRFSAGGAVPVATSTPPRPGGKRETAQSRLWGYLLSSLIRATDEVYSVCETEENELQCREVIRLLETALADFRELISRFKLHSRFEATTTSGDKPPTGIAWSVRKISPMHVVRVAAGSPTRPGSNPGAPSYADRVRGARRARKSSTGDAAEDAGNDAAAAGDAVGAGAGPTAAEAASAAAADGSEGHATSTSPPGKDPGGVGKKTRGGGSKTGANNTNDADAPSDPEDEPAEASSATVPAGTNATAAPAARGGEENGSAAANADADANADGAADADAGAAKDVAACDAADGSSGAAADRPSSPADASSDPPDPTPTPPASCGVPAGVLWGDLANDPDWSSDSDDGGSVAAASPGSTVLLHHRLSSPSRKRTNAESLRISEEKQARATEMRERRQQELAERLRRENSKLEAARERREIEEFRRVEDMVLKRQRAEELRGAQLDVVRKKGKEEDLKIEEIAFITRLEEENKKREVLDRLNESQERLQEIEGERQRKALEKAAREDAAAERRRALEQERAARLREQEERRAARERKIEEDKRRSAAERERAAAQREQVHRRREEMALAETAGRKVLEERLEAKLSSAERRKSSLIEERIERIAQPRPVSPQRPQRRDSGASTGAGDGSPARRSASLNLSRPADELLPAAVEPPPPPARNEKSLKKRVKRIRQRMAERARVVVVAAAAASARAPDGDTKPAEGADPLQSVDVASPDAGGALEKHAAGIGKLLRRVHAWHVATVGAKGPPDTAAFDALALSAQKTLKDKGAKLGGSELAVLARLMVDVCAARPTDGGADASAAERALPVKSVGLAFAVVGLAMAVKGRGGAVVEALCTRDYPLKLVDVFVRVVPEVYAAPAPVTAGVAPEVTPEPRAAAHVTKALGRALFALFEAPGEGDAGAAAAHQQVTDDIIMYCSAVGWFDVVTQLMYRVPRTWIESESCVSNVVEDCLDAILLFCSFDPGRRRPAHVELLEVLHSLHLAGIVSPLLTQVVPPKRAEGELRLEQRAESSAILLLGVKILNRLSVLDLAALQHTLGEEWLSTALCFVLTRLLSHFCDCTSRQGVAQLHEAIYFVGKFATGNPRGQQMLAHHGGFATILPILCKLPFKYFSVDECTEILFPTLLSICYKSDENAAILQRELSIDSVVAYIDRKLRDTAPSDDRFACCNRFPADELPRAREFFASLARPAAAS